MWKLYASLATENLKSVYDEKLTVEFKSGLEIDVDA
jgi:hypothetical protein